MINRDGFTRSIWQEHSQPFMQKKISQNQPYDVIIVGGGITGVSSGYLLQKSGLNCLIVEAKNLCFGTTGGTTAHLNTLMDTPYTTICKNFGKEKAQQVFELTSDAIDLIKRHIKELGIDCGFSDQDAFLFAEDDKQAGELDDIIFAGIEAGLDINLTDELPIDRPFIAVAKASGQAKFNPLPYVYALAEAFENAGGTIIQNTRITHIQTEDNGLKVFSENNLTLDCRDLIYATHIPPGVNLLHLRCAPWRSYALAAVLNVDNYPVGLIYDMEDPYHYYRTQEIEGQQYLIAGGRDHKTGKEENTEIKFQELEAHVRRYFNVRQISTQWSSQYYESADGLPYIGHLPGSPEHIYVATGFGGNGMVYSSVAAMILRDMLVNKETAYENLFDPNRIKPVAGFSSFVQHNTGIIKEYFKKLLPFEKIAGTTDLAAGEGRLVKFEDKSVALSKDARNKIHAVSPVCTHLNCEVKWNLAEQSWDCPCHGARYNNEGEVLNAPADRALEKIAIDGLKDHITDKPRY